MKTLIAYRTKYGTTADCAEQLAQKLGGEVAVTDLAREPRPDVRGFDVVIVGGSVYAGKIQRQVVSFCERNQAALLKKRVGVFLCCLFTGEEAVMQMQSAFPDWLLAHSFSRVLAGGRVRFGSLSFIDRLLVRSLPHATGDISRLRPEALEELAAAARAAGKPG